MRRSSFRGGVHAPHSKEATQGLPVRPCPAPDTLILPMRQHLGAPCTPCVEKGQRVLLGETVGKPQGFVSAPVHASVSGIIVDIGPRPAPGGDLMTSVVIENDGLDEAAPPLPPLSANAPRKELLDRILACGVVGMGGAAFPTHVKLSPPPEKPVDTLLINGSECAPYLTTDHRLMLEHTGTLLEGIGIAMYILGVSRALIGVEDNKPDAIAALREIIPPGLGIDVIPLPTRYPQGGEKILIRSLLGREVPSGGLPADAGCVVLNVGTLVAVADAVLRGIPLTQRIVTVTGPGVKQPANLLMRLGTPFRVGIEACGGATPAARRLISGGPMMGILQYTDEVPVIKGTTGILLMEAEDYAPTRPCISCGRCAAVCPAGLMSMRLSEACRRGDIALARKLGLMDCMECGCCTFSCPSLREVLTPIRTGKRLLAEQRRRDQEPA